MRFYLRPTAIRAALQRNHMTQREFCRRLGVSPTYFSCLINRKRHVSAPFRRLLLSSGVFEATPESELWDVVTSREEPDGRS